MRSPLSATDFSTRCLIQPKSLVEAVEATGQFNEEKGNKTNLRIKLYIHLYWWML